MTFVGKLYPGSTSDKEMVRTSGLPELLQAGDLILADKGFLINDIVRAGVSVNIPLFLSTPQFTSSKIHATKNIARARVQIKRAIHRIIF